jgi:hypothetical protein
VQRICCEKSNSKRFPHQIKKKTKSNQTTSQAVDGKPSTDMTGPSASALGPLCIGVLQKWWHKASPWAPWEGVAAILERSFMAGTLHIHPLLGFHPQGSALSTLTSARRLQSSQGSVTNNSMGRAAATPDISACPHNLFFFVLLFVVSATAKIKHLKWEHFLIPAVIILKIKHLKWEHFLIPAVIILHPG